MTRFLCLIIALLTSACALGETKSVQPSLFLTVGEETGQVWARCTVTPSKVAVAYVPDKNQRSFSKAISLDAKKLGEQVAAAAKTELNKGMHIVETVPHIRIEAETKGIERFTLLYDAGGYDSRHGKDVDDLVATVTRVCGKIDLLIP